MGAPDRHPKALDGNGSVKKHGGTREREACDGEEGRAAVRGLACTSREEIQTKGGDCTRKGAGQYARDDTRRCEGLFHTIHTGVIYERRATGTEG